MIPGSSTYFNSTINEFLRLATGTLDIAQLSLASDRDLTAANGMLIVEQMKCLDQKQEEVLLAAVCAHAYLLLVAAARAENTEDDAIQKAKESLLELGLSVPADPGVDIHWSGDSGYVRVHDPEVRSALYHSQSDLIAQLQRQRLRSHVLLESLLVTLTSGFEHHVRRLFRGLAEAYPKMLGSSEHAFTLNELMEFTTIDDACRSLIEKKIDSIMAEGVEGWERRLEKSDIGVIATKIAREWRTVREIFARRNLFVHNESQVNQRYLKILRDLKFPDLDQPRLGATLTVSPEYFSRSAEILTDAALNLTIACWIKCQRQASDDVARCLYHVQRQLFNLNHWSTVIHSANLVMSEASLSREYRVRLQIRSWTAARKAGTKGGAIKELCEWDTSGLNLDLAHAKDVLLGHHERAISSIRQLLHMGSLSRPELYNDPLYFELRELRLLDELMYVSTDTEESTTDTP